MRLLFSLYKIHFFYPESPDRIKNLIVVFAGIFISTVLITGYKQSRGKIKSRSYEFQFNKIDFNKINYEELKIDQEEI